MELFICHIYKLPTASCITIIARKKASVGGNKNRNLICKILITRYFLAELSLVLQCFQRQTNVKMKEMQTSHYSSVLCSFLSERFIDVANLTRNPGGMYLLKVNNRNSRTRCEICLNLTIKTPERREHWRTIF